MIPTLAEPPRPYGDRPVVAAVHPRSRHLDSIVARAKAKAAAAEKALVFLTVVTARPLSTELRAMRGLLSHQVWPIHFVASWVDPDGVSDTDLSSQTVIELICGAADLNASTLVLGQDLAAISATDIAGRIATFLPTETELCFGLPGSSRSEELVTADAAFGDRPWPWRHWTHLDRDGITVRTLGAARIERHRARTALQAIARDPLSGAALRDYEIAVNNLRRLAAICADVCAAGSVPPQPLIGEVADRHDLVGV